VRDAELSVIPALAVDSYTSRLARLYLAAGDTDSAVKTAARIRDVYSRAGINISAARILKTKGNTARAASLLDESYALAQTAGQSHDRILQDISGACLADGDIHKAVTLAAEISDPYAFAAATADLIRFFLEKKTPPDVELIRNLEDVLNKTPASAGPKR
jgi:hypothetical protein